MIKQSSFTKNQASSPNISTGVQALKPNFARRVPDFGVGVISEQPNDYSISQSVETLPIKQISKPY